ncbi:hypothetical protein [Mesorhizobium sangaii]|uniref:Uncharacterized protein n=1 Tax=Mesorhizobium sangaii TaxID=505389 RepID=A0A841PUR2_9HYPH|nr:hypothetical protein [Mesorhizobium sangaii]MBB6413782.1 hypothetical protein [Mesorhizobium sangaii]
MFIFISSQKIKKGVKASSLLKDASLPIPQDRKRCASRAASSQFDAIRDIE